MRKFLVLIVVTVSIISVQLGFKTKEPATRAELGRLLFFDPILSADSTISCGSCHRPDFAFADTSALSKGVGGLIGTRNSPSVMNISLNRSFFWDGRVKTIEEQALEPISNPVEMNLPVDSAVARLQRHPKYASYFETLMGGPPDRKRLGAAIAEFEKTLETNQSPFDKWKLNDDSTMVSAAARRGFVIFSRKGKCTVCHFGSDFTTREFRNVGLFDGKMHNDSGRMNITHLPEDLGKFKVPGLRNIALTAPYMHNGMLRTLEEVVEFYDDTRKVVPGAINIDSTLAKPLKLTKSEKRDLVIFLRSLTDERFKRH